MSYGNRTNEPYNNGIPTAVAADLNELIKPLMLRVFNWMAIGLALTAIVSLVVFSIPSIFQAIFSNKLIFYGLMISELGMVFAISAAINRISAQTAIMLFFAYAALNGVTMSFIFAAYTASSITSTFFVTAGTFGAMSFYGYVTKKDLTGWGNLLFMALIGLIIASIVNIFLGSEMIYWITSFAGVAIFVGLTAYDTQKIKVMLAENFTDEDSLKKVAVLGALALYLDFINLFLYLLRFLGRRK